MYSLKVLYAEDDEKLRNQYVKFLKTIFSNVYECKDGEEASDYYEYHKPDIVVLDINMPLKNGLEVAADIRKVDEKAKIIILTSYSDKEKLLKAIPLNLVDYLIKPVKLMDFKNTLEKCAREILDMDTSEIVSINKNIKYDSVNGVLTDGETKKKLTRNEKKLIELFIKNNYKTITMEILFDNIWEDYDYSMTKLRSLINRLNAKLQDKIIVSDYGIGYKINKDIEKI